MCRIFLGEGHNLKYVSFRIFSHISIFGHYGAKTVDSTLPPYN